MWQTMRKLRGLEWFFWLQLVEGISHKLVFPGPSVKWGNNMYRGSESGELLMVDKPKVNQCQEGWGRQGEPCTKWLTSRSLLKKWLLQIHLWLLGEELGERLEGQELQWESAFPAKVSRQLGGAEMAWGELRGILKMRLRVAWTTMEREEAKQGDFWHWALALHQGMPGKLMGHRTIAHSQGASGSTNYFIFVCIFSDERGFIVL